MIQAFSVFENKTRFPVLFEVRVSLAYVRVAVGRHHTVLTYGKLLDEKKCLFWVKHVFVLISLDIGKYIWFILKQLVYISSFMMFTTEKHPCGKLFLLSLQPNFGFFTRDHFERFLRWSFRYECSTHVTAQRLFISLKQNVLENKIYNFSCD